MHGTMAKIFFSSVFKFEYDTTGKVGVMNLKISKHHGMNKEHVKNK